MNSKMVQHYKLDGRYIGEIDMDAYIAASHGVPSIFFAGGDIACSQARRAVPGIVTVVTKKELSRNRAIYRDNTELIEDIKAGVTEAIRCDVTRKEIALPAMMEKSFKRMEDAAQYLDRLLSLGVEAAHPCEEILGKDAHTVVSKINSINDFITCI
jgi:D-aminopeptidase